MTNQIAIAIILLFAGMFIADHFWLHLGLPVFLGKAADRFIDQLSFWR